MTETNRDFYMPRLFATPTKATLSYALWLRMPKLYIGKGRRVMNYNNIIDRAIAQQCDMQHSVRGVCALESSS